LEISIPRRSGNTQFSSCRSRVTLAQIDAALQHAQLPLIAIGEVRANGHLTIGKRLSAFLVTVNLMPGKAEVSRSSYLSSFPTVST
jgi:hypothetical protein